MYGGLRVYACAAISLPPWQSNTEDRFCLVELLHFHKIIKIDVKSRYTAMPLILI
jgi:hypothetical protein